MKTHGLVVFSHGKDSHPGAAKIAALRPVAEERGWDVDALDYRGMDTLSAWVDKLSHRLSTVRLPIVLVGSSMGGAVSVFAAQVKPVLGLFLLAPAVYFPGYEHLDYAVTVPLIEVVHGWADDVVPPTAVTRWAEEQNADLHMLHDDHRLIDSLPKVERLFCDFLARVQKAHL